MTRSGPGQNAPPAQSSSHINSLVAQRRAPSSGLGAGAWSRLVETWSAASDYLQRLSA
jgi:hypothetical protein